MRCGGAMSSASGLNDRQVPSLLHCEKDEEKLLPTCVHGHVAKSTSADVHHVEGHVFGSIWQSIVRGMRNEVELHPREGVQIVS